QDVDVQPHAIFGLEAPGVPRAALSSSNPGWGRGGSGDRICAGAGVVPPAGGLKARKEPRPPAGDRPGNPGQNLPEPVFGDPGDPPKPAARKRERPVGGAAEDAASARRCGKRPKMWPAID